MNFMATGGYKSYEKEESYVPSLGLVFGDDDDDYGCDFDAPSSY